MTQLSWHHLLLTSWHISLPSIKSHLVIVMCVKFAVAADPHSAVFTNMASSRITVVRRMNDIYSYLKDKLHNEIQKAFFFSIMADESTDTAVSEQLILYMRYVDINRKEIVTHFSGI